MSKYLLLACSVLFLLACNPKVPQASKIYFDRTGEVECVKYEENVIHVVSTSRASTASEAAAFAERNAVENLLFKGIPKSNQEEPIVADELESLRKHKFFYEQFLEGRDYEKFIINSELRAKKGGGPAIQVRQYVEFDLKAMREHLESKGVIQKFGL